MIPVGLRLHPEPQYVEWARVRREDLRGTFFDEDVRELPVRRERVASLALTDREPAGLVFHVSRCGSSAVVNGLAAIDGMAVISEAQPVGEAVTHGDVQMLRSVISAVGAVEGATAYVVKFRSGDTLRIGDILRAWPDVPWLMVIRDPVEVVVSQLAHPGGWLRTKQLRKARMTDEQYCALTFAHFCNHAAAALRAGNGRILDYSELSADAVIHIASNFGVKGSAEDRAAVAEACSRNSKQTGLMFSPDSEARQALASELVREMVAKFAAGPYHALRELSASLRAEVSRPRSTSVPR